MNINLEYLELSRFLFKVDSRLILDGMIYTRKMLTLDCLSPTK